MVANDNVKFPIRGGGAPAILLNGPFESICRNSLDGVDSKEPPYHVHANVASKKVASRRMGNLTWSLATISPYPCGGVWRFLESLS
jgi:hypothetical protein